MTRVFIGVGSNIGPEENIRVSLRMLAQSVRLVSISTFYREPAIGRPEEPDFYNGVVAIDTDLPPATLKWQVLGRFALLSIFPLAPSGRHWLVGRLSARRSLSSRSQARPSRCW